ncbi:MAG: sterol desaturase family protein [Desulfobulbaceae bacterium]|nr:sterol desaturase family protein [Desulfobulbaceae bacterium]
MGKHFVSNQTESVKMFGNPVVEALSKVHWTVPLIVYIPIILFFQYQSIFTYNFGILESFALFLGGLFIWTLTEYLLHRFVFHFEPKSPLGKRLHWMFHGVHHDYPQDRFRLVMPPSISLPLATMFYFLFLLVFGSVHLPAIFSGFLAGYLAYDTIHYAIHHNGFRNKFMLKIKQHHMRHHYTEPNEGYGVSSPLWDYVFNTRPTKKLG